MNAPSVPRSKFHRLVQTVRRRWIAIRAVEGGAIGLGVGAAVCFVLIALMWWHQRPSLAAVGAVLAMAGSTGAAVSLLLLPSPLETARRIDQQHGLSDLISTALTLDRRDDPAMAAVVRQLADESAERIARRPVVVARYGEAAYASVALGASLALAVAAVASHAFDERRREGGDRGSVVAAERLGSMSAYGENTTGFRQHHSLAAIFSPPLNPTAKAWHAHATPPDSPWKSRGSRGASPSGGEAASATGVHPQPAVDPAAPAARRQPVSGNGVFSAETGAPTVPGFGNLAGNRPGIVQTGPGEARPSEDVARTSSASAAVGPSSAAPGVPDAYRGLVNAYFQRE